MIKPEADEAYFSRNPHELRLAEAFDEAFDITHGHTHGDLGFWLALPKEHVRDRFGLQREVPVIYSPHPTTDARVLTALENIGRSPDFKHRLDPVVCILVHAGNVTDAQQLAQGYGDRIIVPIHADDLKNSKRGSVFLRSRLASAIGRIDLFGVSSPITVDKDFFGDEREAMVQELISLTTLRRECAGLFGLRKTGKTSVLRAFQRRITERRILAQYIDCGNPGVHAPRWWQTLHGIASLCADTLQRDFKRTARLATGEYTETTAGLRFSRDMHSLLSDGALENIVLLVDEIEWISFNISGRLGRHWDEDFVPFWQTMRAVHHETEGKFTFLLAGVNPRAVEAERIGPVVNPIFQLASPQFLGPFSVQSVRGMVRTLGKYSGLHISEDVFSYLRATYGGHPYLIRRACSVVTRAIETTDPERLAKVTVADFQARRDEIRERIAQPIKDILLSLVWWYPDEYDVLLIAALGDTAFAKEYFESSAESLLRFTRYGLLTPERQFEIEDLKSFLIQFGEAYKQDVSPFARGDMPPDLLPEVPDLKTLGRMFEKKVQVEVALRRIIVYYISVGARRDPELMAKTIAHGLRKTQERKDPTQPFVGRAVRDVVNDLYLSDLKDIVVDSWTMFGHLFDGNMARFEMNMDVINRARRVDSHSRPISEEEAGEFENSYQWLLSKIRPVLKDFE